MDKERSEADESKDKATSENVQQKAELINETKDQEDTVDNSKDVTTPTDKTEESGAVPETATAEVTSKDAEALPGKPDEVVDDVATVTPKTITAEEDPEVSAVKDKEATSESEQQPEAIDQSEVQETVSTATEDTNIESQSATETEPESDVSDDSSDELDKYAEIDFGKSSKDDLLNIISELAALDDPRRAEGVSREVKNAFDAVFNKERQDALEKFKADGGEAADFEYKHDVDAEKFEEYIKIIRERKAKYYRELEKQKDENLEKKNELLEKLRQIVDGEESTTSINTLKSLQEEWKAIGPVPGAHNKTLWANYNALIDRFYDNRSIYFELKELDRKKNLDSKLELCEKAEQLDAETNIKEAVKQLNELHEEFKHIGPVPKDDQEALWLRFKAASDKIYVKRKGFVDQLKSELKENMRKKLELGEEVSAFLQFDSDRINEWNDKTKALLDLQRKWESIGGLPREHAKEVNKKFWSSFKGFFANKNKFFKKLESMRDDNLLKKEELVARAEELKDSVDWNTTTETFKRLQREWKEIGPVPEKKRNDVYKRFKEACDTFFNSRREQTKGAEKDFENNLKAKEAICDQLEQIAKSTDLDKEAIFKLQEEYAQIGFVPRNAIKKIQKRYDHALEAITSSTSLDKDELSAFKANLSVNKLKGAPNADRRLNRKEQGIRRRITQIETDLNTWKTNMEFFASSATADKLKDQVENNIKEAESELEVLKAELRVLRNS